MLKKLLVHQTNHIFIQFFRYGFVALAAFIVDFGLLFVFTHYLNIYYLISATLSFLISLVLNYWLSTLWVFSHSSKKRAVEVTAFLIINLVGLALNMVIIWLCTSLFGMYYLYSKLIAVTLVFFWSFLARRYFIFKGSDKVVPEL